MHILVLWVNLFLKNIMGGGVSQLELINNHTDDVGASKTQDMI